MKHFLHASIAMIFFGLLDFSCSSSHTKEESVNATDSLSKNQDSISLTKLIREVYLWQNNKIKNNMFAPATLNPSDSIYSGLDKKMHNDILNLLRKSDYFDNTFISNYDNIAQDIDKELSKGTTVWNVGDMPPFGYQADPWCNCQDNPDNYWQIITLKNIVIHKNIASFEWTWGDDFSYKAKASLDNGIWKINYLEGFEASNFKLTN